MMRWGACFAAWLVASGCRYDDVVRSVVPDAVSATESDVTPVDAESEPDIPACPQPAASDLVYVPAGPAVIGCPGEGFACGNDAPSFVIEMPAFYIMRNEVTIGEFRACLEAGMCKPHDPSSTLVGSEWWDDCRIAKPIPTESDLKHPVDCTSLDQVWDYCKFVGLTGCWGSQWERAARGPGTNSAVLPAEGCSPDWAALGAQTRAVGTTAGDVSPSGVNDMFANVAEWVGGAYLNYETQDNYGEWDPYSGLRRGGVLNEPAPAFRRFPGSDLLHRNVGIRCCLQL